MSNIFSGLEGFGLKNTENIHVFQSQDETKKKETGIEEDKKEISALREQVGVRWAYADGSLPKWAQKTVQKLCGLGLLQGDVTGSLALSYQFLRTLVILDRAGVFDGK